MFLLCFLLIATPLPHSAGTVGKITLRAVNRFVTEIGSLVQYTADRVPFKQCQYDIQGVSRESRQQLLLHGGVSEHSWVGIYLQQVGLHSLVDNNITAKQLVCSLLGNEFSPGSSIHCKQDPLDTMADALYCIAAYFFFQKQPSGDGLILTLFVQLVLFLEAVICQMHHEAMFVFKSLLGIILEGHTQIALVEQHKLRLTVDQQIATDIELLTVQQQRTDIMLNESIVLQLPVLVSLLALRCQVKVVLQHVVEGELSEVKLFAAYELSLEGCNVGDYAYASPLVEVPRLVDPDPRRVVVHELYLVAHEVQPKSLGSEFSYRQTRAASSPHYFHFPFPKCPEQLQLGGHHRDVGDMVNDLQSLFERVEIDFASRLHPFKKIVRRELFLGAHQVVSVFAQEIVLDKLAVISLPNHDLPHLPLALLDECQVSSVLQGGICKHGESITQPFVTPFIQPFVLLAVALEDALEPLVDGTIVKLYVVVQSRLEFVRVEYLYGSFLPACPDGPALAHVYLHMHHAVRKSLKLGVVVSRTVEDEIAWLEVGFSLAFVWEQVQLVCLVPLRQSIPELSAEIKHALSNECTTVQEEGGVEERVAWVVKFLCIGHSNVLVGCQKQLLPELLLELRRSAIYFDGLEVLVEFKLVELLLLEALEGLLDRLLGSMLLELVLLVVRWLFHFKYSVQISLGINTIRLSRQVNITQHDCNARNKHQSKYRQSSSGFHLALAILELALIPLFRADILGALDLGEQVVVECEVLDGVASYVSFFDAAEGRPILHDHTVTLSVSTASPILIFMKRSTPRRMPLQVSPDFTSTIIPLSSATLIICNGSCIHSQLRYFLLAALLLATCFNNTPADSKKCSEHNHVCNSEHLTHAHAFKPLLGILAKAQHSKLRKSAKTEIKHLLNAIITVTHDLSLIFPAHRLRLSAGTPAPCTGSDPILSYPILLLQTR